MRLWQRIQRCLATGVLAATAAVAAPQPVAAQSLETRIEQTVQKKELAQQRRAVWLLSGTALSLAALGLAHLFYRANKRKLTPLQPAVEHPYWAGAVTAVSYAVPIAAWQLPPENVAFAGGMMGALCFMIMRFFHDVRPPYAHNAVLKAVDCTKLLFLRDPEKRKEVYKHIRSYYAFPAKVDIDLIGILFAQEQVDEALESLKRIVAGIEDAVQQTAYERHIIYPLCRRILLAIGGYPFERFYEHLRLGRLHDALAALDAFVHDEPSPSRFAARAYVVQSLADLWPSLSRLVPKPRKAQAISLEERADAAWQDTIRVILADPQREQQFRLMGESRNEVLEYAPNKFLQGLLVFKRCDANDGKRLRQEHEAMAALQQYFGRHVAKSLAYVEHEGKAYHVLRHGTGRTLEKVLLGGEEDDQVNAWIAAADLLDKCQHLDLPWALSSIGQGYYAQRLQKVFYGQCQERSCIDLSSVSLEELARAGERVQRELADAPQGWYKDANWRNWLVEDDGTVVAIDFEHRIKAPVFLDYVSLLESGPGDDAQRASVRTNLFTRLNKDGQYSHDQLEQWYRVAALQRHLEFAGYRARDEEYDRVRFHLQRAYRYAAELGENKLADQLAQVRVRGGAPSAGH